MIPGYSHVDRYSSAPSRQPSKLQIRRGRPMLPRNAGLLHQARGDTLHRDLRLVRFSDLRRSVKPLLIIEPPTDLSWLSV